MILVCKRATFFSLHGSGPPADEQSSPPDNRRNKVQNFPPPPPLFFLCPRTIYRSYSPIEFPNAKLIVFLFLFHSLGTE